MHSFIFTQTLSESLDDVIFQTAKNSSALFSVEEVPLPTCKLVLERAEVVQSSHFVSKAYHFF